MSKIYHVAAISTNNVIGKGGTLPWRLPQDLKRFSAITKGHPVIMGRKTFESLGSRPLKYRFNVVVSTTVPEGEHKGARFVNSIERALELVSSAPEIYIIGGSSLYEATLPIADELRITHVNQEVVDDGSCVFYPPICPETWTPSYKEKRRGFMYVDYVRILPLER